ncbi:MAG: hypothetical protein KGP14_12385 [Betaproteobacteria bacterium]|nr:hypothetical protein [Betaproteobacteria bacterium]
MIVIGIDPGLTGAIAAECSSRGLLDVADLPTCSNGLETGRMLRWIDPRALCQLLRDWSQRFDFGQDHVQAVIERPIAMPNQQISTAASNFDSLGVIRGVLASKGVDARLITPGAWKRYYRIGTDKDESLRVARNLYPAAPIKLKKHHNRAEAILIGRFELRTQA